MYLDDIKAYLDAMGASSASWPIKIGFMPDDSDQCIALFPTGGYPADTLGRENTRPTFQLRVRAGRFDFPIAYAKWQECFDLLQDAQHTSGSPALLVGFYLVQAMQTEPLGTIDDKNRNNLTNNFRVMKSR